MELEVAAADLEFRDGAYRVKGTDVTIRLDEIARRYAGGANHPLNAKGEIPLPRSFPSGAHAAEVEIDPETGVIEIARYTAVDDCGRAGGGVVTLPPGVYRTRWYNCRTGAWQEIPDARSAFT